MQIGALINKASRVYLTERRRGQFQVELIGPLNKERREKERRLIATKGLLEHEERDRDTSTSLLMLYILCET